MRESRWLPSLDYRHALYFNHDAGAGEGGDGQEGAARVTAIGEVLAPDRDEAVAVARVVDEDGHGYEVGERAAGALQRAVDKREDGAGLLVELAGDVLAVQVGHGGLAGEPDGLAALGDDGGGEGAALLEVGAFEVLNLCGRGHRSPYNSSGGWHATPHQGRGIGGRIRGKRPHGRHAGVPAARVSVRRARLRRGRAASCRGRLPHDRALSARLRSDAISLGEHAALGAAGGAGARSARADGRARDRAGAARRL